MNQATSRATATGHSATRPSGLVMRFSTTDYAPQDRLAAWRRAFGGGVHNYVEVESIDGAPPRTTIEMHRVADTVLYFSRTSPIRALRTSRSVQNGDDDFRLMRVEGAAYRFTSDGVDAIVPDGGAALLSNTVVGTVEYFGPCRVNTIRISRTALSAAAREFDDRPIRCIAPDSPALRLLAAYAEAVRLGCPSVDPMLAAQASRHLIDLTALALGADDDETVLDSARAARLRAIKGDVESNLGSDSLSIATVAARHRLPVRYVQRLFEAEGVTFTAFVLERRLAHARRLLVDPRHDGQPIGVIALESGFINHTYFARAFRNRFGATPSDVRAQARPAS